MLTDLRTNANPSKKTFEKYRYVQERNYKLAQQAQTTRGSWQLCLALCLSELLGRQDRTGLEKETSHQMLGPLRDTFLWGDIREGTRVGTLLVTKVGGGRSSGGETPSIKGGTADLWSHSFHATPIGLTPLGLMATCVVIGAHKKSVMKSCIQNQCPTLFIYLRRVNEKF